MEPSDAIFKGLKIYRNEMRVFIRETLQAKYGEAWFSERVAPLLHGKEKRERGLKAVLTRGQSAERQIDVGDFAIVIAHHGGLFPEPIRSGQHHHGRLNELRDARNAHAHDKDETLYPADAEAVLGKCREVLSLCGRMSAVRAIESIARQLSAVPPDQEASVPTPIEDAATPTTDEFVESRGFVTTLRDVRAVVGGLMVLAAVAVSIFFAVDRLNSQDDSSTPTGQDQVTETTEPAQEVIAIPSENGRGGGVQEQTTAAAQQASNEGGSTQEQTAIVAQQASIEDDLCRVVDDLTWLPRMSDAPIQLDGTWSSSDCESPWTGRSYSDRYRIHLSERTSVTITLTSDGERPYLTLFSEDEEPLASDDAGEGGNSQIMRTLGAGTYYVEAATYRRNQTGSYNLRVSYAALQTATELAIPQDLAVVQARLARALFGPGKPTYHDYNSYGAQVPGWAGGCRGYDGGHSGWDAQTQSVAGTVPTRDEPFFSLTTGVVIRAGGDDFNTIAVYDAVQDVTTLYAHARRVDVRVGQTVRVGTQLGIQGNAGLSSGPTDREHVHVEVRRGRVPWLACGATDAINPFNYLYHSVTAAGS